MKAVNLIPSDARRGRVSGGLSLRPGYLALAALAVVLIFVTIVVITDNTISSRKAKLASLRSQLVTEQAVAARLGVYERFVSLAQARAATIRQIVATRFDWHSALSDLSRVVPANTSLQSLNATVSSSTTGGSGGSSLRGYLPGPAFDITGCTQTQDDVARLISRLRTMDGVVRVALQTSAKPATPQAAPTTGVSSSTGSTGTCGNGPTFHLVVFFQPLSTAGSTTPGAPSPLSPASVTSSASSAASGSSK